MIQTVVPEKTGTVYQGADRVIAWLVTVDGDSVTVAPIAEPVQAPQDFAWPSGVFSEERLAAANPTRARRETRRTLRRAVEAGEDEVAGAGLYRRASDTGRAGS